MKIALINDVVYKYAIGSPAASGGAERYQWLLARALAQKGWSVAVGAQTGVPRNGDSIDGVAFVRLGHGYHLREWYSFLKSERPDWWYWQCADHNWGPAVEIAKLLGVRTIFSAAVDRDVHLTKALYRRPYCWPLYAWGLLRSDKIFVQHEGQRSHLPRMLQGKASILPGIVSATPDVLSHSARGNYVAWVAMLREVKRPDVLIEIARALPQITFVVCGGPTTYFARPGYGEKIVNEFRSLPNIEYRGHVAPGEAINTICHAALLLSTSDEEGFPSTFLEAWSAGTPVMSLKLDPECAIARFALGTVPGTVERAVEQIASLVASAERRDQIAAHAREYIAENHSETAVTNAFEQGIQLVAQRHRIPTFSKDAIRKI